MMTTSTSFNVDGLVSGLRTSEIVSGLMGIERRPLLALQRQKALEENRKAAWSAVKSQVSALQAAAQKLALRGTINAKLVSTDTPSTSPAVVSASATAEAANGSFKVLVERLATQTANTSSSYMGQAISQTALLQDAGFASAADTSQKAGVDRYFTINGVRITADSNDKLFDATDTPNSMVHKIQSALDASSGSTGWVVQLVADATGRPANALSITAPAGAEIHLGAGDDTSNFLISANLLGTNPTAPTGGSVTSTLPLAGTKTGEPIGSVSARLSTPLSGQSASGAGAFKINGVRIDFNGTDSLNTIINRINAANAGVRASYDPATDRMRLTNVATGGQAIVVEDDTVTESSVTTTSNFLDATGLRTAGVTYGQTALYRIDGGAQQSSGSNIIGNVRAGVNLTLKSVSATEVTVNVNQDVASTKRAVQDFVSAYNGVAETIAKQSAYNQTTKQGSPLTGDVSLQSLERELRSLVSSAAVGVPGSYQTLADIGISTGKFTGSVDAIRKLQLDDAKLTAALQDNVQSVESLLGAFTASVGSLSGLGNVTTIDGLPTSNFESGRYTVEVTDAATGAGQVWFTADSGTESPRSNATLTAGTSNTAAITGMTFNTAGVLAAGQDTFRLDVTQRGVMVRLKSSLASVLGTGGLFETRDKGATDEATGLENRIRDMEDRLAEKEKALYRRFAALEAALAKMQTQSSSLGSALARLS